MPKAPSYDAQVSEELKKIGWNTTKQGKCPWLIRVVLVSIKRRELPLWLKILLNLRFGKFKTPDGIEYNGFKIEFKW